MADEIIGSLGVEITGDYSPLEDAINQATQAATTGASEIASAFSQLGTDGATQGVQALGAALTDIQSEASDASGQMSLVSQSTTDASEQLQLFDTNSIDAADSMQQVGDAASSASSGVSDLASSTTEAGGAATEAESGLQGMAEQLTAVGEALIITEGLKEFGEEALTAYGTVQSVTIGLTALTGSAEKADEVVTQIKELAATEPFAFPEIAPTVQKMVALGVSTEQIGTVMQAAADASAATVNQFGNVANMLDRMSLSGTVNARSMATLGISTTDLGNAMGVTADQATAAFKALDQQQRIEAISEALSKFAGTAEAKAQSISGQWQIFKNEFEEVMVSVGQDLAPVVGDILSFGKTVLGALQEAADAFKSLPQPVQDVAVGIGLAATAAAGLVGVLGALAIGVNALGGLLPAITGLFGDFAGAEEAAGAGAVTASEGVGVLSGAVSVLTDAVPLAAAAFGAWKLSEWVADNKGATALITDLGTAITAIGEVAGHVSGVIGSFFSTISFGTGALGAAGSALSALAASAGNLMPNFQELKDGWAQLNHETIDYAPLVQNAASVTGILNSALSAGVSAANDASAAHLNLVNAVNSEASAHTKATQAAQGHKAVLDTMATATVPTFAQAVSEAANKIVSSQEKVDGQLQLDMGAWAQLATSSTASAQEISDAASKASADASKLGMTAQQTADLWTENLAKMGLTVDTFIGAWNDAVKQFGSGSDEAQTAFNNMAFVFGGDTDKMKAAIQTYADEFGGMVAATVNGKQVFVDLGTAAVNAAGAVTTLGQSHLSAADKAQQLAEQTGNATGKIIDLTNYVHSSAQNAMDDYSTSVNTTTQSYGDLQKQIDVLAQEMDQTGDPAILAQIQLLEQEAQAAADAQAAFQGMAEAQSSMGGGGKGANANGQLEGFAASILSNPMPLGGGGAFDYGGLTGGGGVNVNVMGGEAYEQQLSAQVLQNQLVLDPSEAAGLQAALNALDIAMGKTVSSTQSLDHALVGGSLKPSLDLTTESTTKLDQALSDPANGLARGFDEVGYSASTSAEALASVGPAYSETVKTLSNGVQELTTSLNGVATGVRELYGTVMPSFNSSIGGSTELLASVGPAYSETVKTLSNGVQELTTSLNGVATGVRELYGTVTNLNPNGASAAAASASAAGLPPGTYATKQDAINAGLNPNELAGNPTSGYYQEAYTAFTIGANSEGGGFFNAPNYTASGTGGGNAAPITINISGMTPGNAQYVVNQMTTALRNIVGLKIT